MKQKNWTAAELDARYWEAELLAAVARHDAAIDALHLASDELIEVRHNLLAARERLATSRRAPTPITIHPSWAKQNAS